MPYNVQNPIAWVGDDRILISDVTPGGLHRKVIARKGELMDVEEWVRTTESEARGNPVEGWLVEIEDFFILWLIWKESKK